MARNSVEVDEGNIDPASVLSEVKSSIKPVSFSEIIDSNKYELSKLIFICLLNFVLFLVKQNAMKDLLYGSFEVNKSKLNNDALTLVVEVAKCLVTETCLRASSQALLEGCNNVDLSI